MAGIESGFHTISIWQVGAVGHRLLREDGIHQRTHEPSPHFLMHCLAVADAHLEVVATARAGVVQSVEVETEPACWRPYTGPAGERRLLQPDLYVVTRQPGYVDRWFCEIDLGTESLKTLLGKCAQYETYRASGIEQSAAGIFPLVVWQLPTEERRDRLASAIARASNLLPELFRLVLPGGLAPLVAGESS